MHELTGVDAYGFAASPFPEVNLLAPTADSCVGDALETGPLPKMRNEKDPPEAGVPKPLRGRKAFTSRKSLLATTNAGRLMSLRDRDGRAMWRNGERPMVDARSVAQCGDDGLPPGLAEYLPRWVKRACHEWGEAAEPEQ